MASKSQRVADSGVEGQAIRQITRFLPIARCRNEECKPTSRPEAATAYSGRLKKEVPCQTAFRLKTV